MLDDTDDKVRRNLLVFSAAVVVSAYIGIPFEAVVRRLMASTEMNIPPERSR
jgi:hypothetical protein